MASHALWWPPTKIAGLYLAPYLLGLDGAHALTRSPEGFSDVDVPLTVDP